MRKRLWYALSALLLVAVISALLARLVFHLFPGTLACHTWRNITTPQSGEHTSFTSVALLSANDVWLAGRSAGSTPQVTRPLVEHWNGSIWQALYPPNLSSFYGTISNIAVVSDSDVWVVGSAYTDPGDLYPTAAHWDGHAWHMLPTSSSDPASYHGYSELSGITALAGDNIWAVGEIDGSGFTQTLVEHWDGSNWKRVASPNVADENNQLTSISAVGANDIWAVGTSHGYQGSQLTLTEHWDGSRWNIVPSPDPSRVENGLVSVTAVSSNNVWTVGVMTPPVTELISAGGYILARDPVRFATQGLIEHWDGQSWQGVTFPKLGKYQILASITAYSSQDVWAAGIFVTEDAQGQQILHGLLEHWDGSAWHSSEDSHAQYLNAIAASAAGGLWSTGFTISPPNSSGGEQTVVETCV